MNSIVSVELLPWLQAVYERCDSQIAGSTFPHASLLAGPAASGKTQLADAVVARLMCREASAPCGQCHQCRLLDAGTHPDYKMVKLEDSKQIVVDQIRQVLEWANQTAQQGGKKVCVISPADCLNIQAANALLKCLEEPPAGTNFLLITDRQEQLLPTIRSRCQLIICPAPKQQEALGWLSSRNESGLPVELLLEIAGGVPLRAVKLVDKEYLKLRQRVAKLLVGVYTDGASPVEMAAGLARDDPETVMDILYQLIADTISSAVDDTGLKNQDLSTELASLSERVTLRARFEFLDRVSRAKGILSGTSNANSQMLMEWVFSG